MPETPAGAGKRLQAGTDTGERDVTDRSARFWGMLR